MSAGGLSDLDKKALVKMAGGAVDLTPKAPEARHRGLQLRHPELGEMMVEVYDKNPAAEVHYEGRIYVEISVEMFMAMVQQVGWEPVDPKTGKTPRETADESE